MAQDIHALIREQVRLIVDPLVLRLRSELYGEAGGYYGPYIAADKIPPSIVTSAAEQAVSLAADGSILVRAFNEFITDGVGIQSGKVVTWNGTVASHADCTNNTHAGKIVGIAQGPSGPGAICKVQTYGILELTSATWNFGGIGSVLCGTNGDVAVSLPNNALFAQHMGVVIGPQKLFVMIQPDPYIF